VHVRARACVVEQHFRLPALTRPMKATGTAVGTAASKVTNDTTTVLGPAICRLIWRGQV